MSDAHTPQQQVWEELYKRFDPQRPPRQKRWRVERKYSPAREIASELARPMGGDKRFMLLGGLGSGKSTELHRIADQRCADGPVIFVDLVDHFEERINDPAALNRVQPWEVLLIIGLAVVQAGEQAFAHRWSKDLIGRFNEVGRKFEVPDGDGQPSFDAAKLASAVVVLAGGAVAVLAAGPAGVGVAAGLVAVGQAGAAVKWRFKLATPGRSRRSDQDERVQSLLGVVNQLLGELRSDGWKLTLFVDGLDRIDERDRIRALFVESALLGGLACDVVMTGPIALHEGVPEFETKMLTNAPVCDRRDPWSLNPRGLGIALCMEVFRRRSADLPAPLIPDPLLRKLVYYSGGRMREFVCLVRKVAGLAWDRSLDQADEEAVERAIETMREVTEACASTRRHRDLLCELLADPSRLPNDELVDEMLDLCVILPYPNQGEWYLPHPLLLKVKLPKPGS